MFGIFGNSSFLKNKKEINTNIFKFKSFELNIKNSFKEKVGCIASFRDEEILVGREDGILQVTNINANKTGNIEIFKKDFDLLDNENIKECITAMDCTSDNSIEKTVFLANEKNIKCIKIKERMSVIEWMQHSKYKNRVSLQNTTQKVFNQQTNTNIFDKTEYESKTIFNVGCVHKYLINSISLNVSNEFLISSDLLKINLWKSDRLEQSFNLVDIKEKLDCGSIFVINCTKFNAYNDTVFGYCTSQGQVVLNDIKIEPKSSEICTFDVQESRNSDNEFRMIKSISDFVFLDEYKIATRTLNNISIFDIRHTKNKLKNQELFDVDSSIFSSDMIYEKFKISHQNGILYTGTLTGEICVFNTNKMEFNKRKVNGIENELQIENGIKHICIKEGTLYCANKDNIFYTRLPPNK
ncbi:PPP2R2D [Ecytonucleospora hepatopenaei]|uniref:PPP2R2D n=1 Tax=Ecytonucleospora hepatopenaei TaxID=646526 RepID=A0A1W0E2P8_9MICR|nr:PPP2R2D [Ecytonucleospora hepatopenaei]